MDTVLDFEARHERAISIVLGAFFALSCAIYARFISLPDIPFVTDDMLFWGSAGLNAGWYGSARPALDRHRERRRLEKAGSR